MKTRTQAPLIPAVLTAVSFAPVAAHDGHAHDADTPTAFRAATPILNVASVEDSIEHYTDVLGFELHWDWSNDEPDKTFASIVNGAVEVFLCERCQGGDETWVYYNVADVDALHERYRASGAEITEAPADRPWGMREMLVEDLDGHVLRIGQPIKDDHEPEPAE